MKYTLAFTLSVITAATHTLPAEELEKAIYDLDVSKVEQLVQSGITTKEQKDYYISLAEQLKASYIPLPSFYKSGKDIIRILGGMALYRLASIIVNTCIEKAPHYVGGDLMALYGSGIAVIPAFYGIRHIIRGTTSYSAKRDLYKVISLIHILKNADTHA